MTFRLWRCFKSWSWMNTFLKKLARNIQFSIQGGWRKLIPSLEGCLSSEWVEFSTSLTDWRSSMEWQWRCIHFTLQSACGAQSKVSIQVLEEKEGFMAGVGSAVMLAGAPQGVGMTRTLSSSHPLSSSPAKTSHRLMNNWQVQQKGNEQLSTIQWWRYKRDTPVEASATTEITNDSFACLEILALKA